MAKRVRIEAIYRRKLDARRVILALREVAEQNPDHTKPFSREHSHEESEEAQHQGSKPPKPDAANAN
ncbi:hypothetical protein Kisp02_48650 [Kineosporia sp. NBRC 101731]|nr:hypothetical protein Kisp02_48650 [Kineosporia sp. NBRC 101731]